MPGRDVYTIKTSDIEHMLAQWDNYINGKEVSNN
jgi:hypothetical protein